MPCVNYTVWDIMYKGLYVGQYIEALCIQERNVLNVKRTFV